MSFINFKNSLKSKNNKKKSNPIKNPIIPDKGEVGGSSPLRPILKKTPFEESFLISTVCAGNRFLRLIGFWDIETEKI